MATLYLARHEMAGGVSRHVAIKVVHPHLARNHEFIDMFLDEARLTMSVRDPGVVDIIDFGEHEGAPYLVMEYISGPSIGQILAGLARQRRRAQPAIVAAIAAKTAEGLHAAHEATDDAGRPLDLVHRDISPQNVLVAYKGYVKVIDFGVARASGRTTETAVGGIKGKFAYMSPEQANAESVDRRTDIYALGIMAWELLTQRRLFTSVDEMGLLRAVQNPVVAHPCSVRPELPRALGEVVLVALAPSRAERFQTADEFGRALYEACPAAYRIGKGELADFVRAVVPEALERERERLPESYTGTKTPPPATDASELAELTCVTSDGDSFDEFVAVAAQTAQWNGVAPVPSAPSHRLPEPPSGDASRRPLVLGGLVTLAAIGVGAYVSLASPVTPSPSPASSLAPRVTPAESPPRMTLSADETPARPPGSDAATAVIAVPAVPSQADSTPPVATPARPPRPPRGAGSRTPSHDGASSGTTRLRRTVEVQPLGEDIWR